MVNLYDDSKRLCKIEFGGDFKNDALINFVEHLIILVKLNINKRNYSFNITFFNSVFMSKQLSIKTLFSIMQMIEKEIYVSQNL